MLILPQEEVERLGGKPGDIDLVDAGAYFWTQLRCRPPAKAEGNKKNIWRGSDGYHDAEALVRYAMVRFERLCHATRFAPSPREHEFRPIKVSASEFDSNGIYHECYEYRAGYQLSTSLLIWPHELETIGISAEPGYLYFRMPQLTFKRLNHEDYAYLDFEPNPDFTLSWRQESNEYELQLSSIPKGVLRDFELLINGIEVPINQVNPLEPRRYSLLYNDRPATKQQTLSSMLNEQTLEFKADTARRTSLYDSSIPIDEQSLEIGTHFSIPHYPRVLKTPFEFPPGWVTDTANFLHCHEGFKDTPFAKSFREFVLSGDTLERAMKAAPKKDATEQFPRGEEAFKGADLVWRYSDNPWLVQMVLFARLIGGPYFTRVLGSLALGFGNSSWDSPIFKSNSGDGSTLRVA